MTQPPDEPPEYPEYPEYGRPQPGPQPGPGAPYGQPYPEAPGEYGGYGGNGGYGQQPAELPRQPVQLGAGARGAMRPWPRTGPAIAAAGAALMLVGTAIWTVGYLLEGLFAGFTSLDAGGSDPDTNRRYLGFGLYLVLTLVGYVVVIARRRGVLATAGTVLAAGGLPLALSFVTFDAATGNGFDNDVIYPVSIVVWLVSYLFVPGARGRAAFLTAAIVSIPSYIAIKIVGDGPLAGLFSFGFGSVASDDTSVTEASDITTLGTVILVFGVVYYALAVLFDRRRRAGVAVAFVIAGFVDTAGGLAILTRDLHAIGLGVLLIVLGVALAGYGGWAGRRFTTWIWAAAVAGGVVAILLSAIDDSFVGAGVATLVVGAVFVVAATAVSKIWREPADLPSEVEALAPPG